MQKNDFLNEISNFTKGKYKYKTIRSLTKASEEIFMCFDGVVSVAVFINNPETFEFELYNSIPENYPFNNIYDFFVEEGIIGKVLSTTETIFNTNNQWQANFIILPLINKDGIIGLCLLDTTVEPSEYKPEQIVILQGFASLLAASLSELMYDAKVKEQNELLDQLVAMRTMHLEEKTKELNDRIVSLTSNLMSSIPHEVRTPINQILGFTKYLKTLLDPSESEENKDISEIIIDIESSAERLKRLFENYLFHTNLVLISMNIQEIESLQKKVTYSPQSVIYETVMNMAYNNSRERDFTLELSDAPIAVYEAFLVKICEELISNSIKFSSNGQNIYVKSYCESDKYVLIFKDFGQGMPIDKISNIGAYIQFDRQNNEQQGLGLGLSIVNRIINIHRGSWDIKSIENEYTIVMIVLPLASKSMLVDL